MKKLAITLASFFSVTASTGFAQEAIVDPALVSQLAIGETFPITLQIVEGDWGSASADINNRIVEFYAPPGLVILSHDIEWRGNHSWVSWVETAPAGNMAYDEGVSAQLTEVMRNGMLSGALTYEGVDMGSAEGAFAYAKFLRDFRARYSIATNNNSLIRFSWGMETKNGRYGAWIDASATIHLQRQPLEEEAQAAVELIRFVLESGHPQDVMSLIETVFAQERKTAAELGLVPDEETDSTPDETIEGAEQSTEEVGNP